DLLGVEQDVFALLVFVTLDDFVVLYRAHPRRNLLIADTLTGRLMDLVKGDDPLGGRGRVELDRDVDEREPQIAGPECAGCHTRNSSKGGRPAAGWGRAHNNGANPQGFRPESSRLGLISLPYNHFP